MLATFDIIKKVDNLPDNIYKSRQYITDIYKTRQYITDIE